MNQTDETSEQFEIFSDGKTVWVNGAGGDCLGRFSRFGIDLHRSSAEQIAGAGQCLDCTHTKPTPADWKRFVEGIKAAYGVTVGDEHTPIWLQKKERS